MPRFSEIGDTTAVENRYADKVIIYVEGKEDVTVFYNITGPGIREFLEFQAPRSGGAGALAVIDKVHAERQKNPRVYGLLDGEAAVDFGEVDTLLLCSDLLFIVDKAELEGLIFLAQHEVENLLLLYGDLRGLIQRDVDFRKFGTLSGEEVDQQIARVARRFFCAALFKYASMTLRYAAKPTGAASICNTINSGRFLERDRLSRIVAKIQHSVKEEGLLNWEDLVAEVRRTHSVLRERFERDEFSAEKRDQERLRLADGKSILTRLGKPHWKSHLLNEAMKSDFAAAFRRRLLDLTAA